ncbi:T6SS immunity protein Tli3 family protein [Paraburkholderia phenoliruptrix]|uniref:T6SS immunity protein Tli3 family protein n=1 Tax=Paraburkholderia phenoliruptrix TaxID=252970 RepID=UPI00320B7FD8
MVRKIIALALSAAAIGCAARQPWSFNQGDFTMAKELPYDSPPQVIYRIDDHRFVTLERYRDCYHGETYYNDTKLAVRSYLGRGAVEDFQGRLINADPTGRNLAFPTAMPPGAFCGNGERGCNLGLLYSTDGGRTFRGMVYFEHSFNPYVDTKAYTVVADGSRVYVSEARQSKAYVVSYPLVPGYAYTGKDALPDGYEIKFDTTVPSGLRTPSGQDHITCDASIKPTNPDAPLVRGRQ